MRINRLFELIFNPCLLTGLAFIFSSMPVFADVHGVVTGTTNYVGRGYTKSHNDLAIQGNLDYQHPSGIYFGAYASSVNFGDRSYNNSARIEFAPYLGVTHKFGQNWQTEVQWVRYLYDGKIFGRQADYNEFQLITHYKDLVSIRASISDDFYGQNKLASDYQIIGRYPITGILEVSSGLGYSQVEQVLENDYLYWNLGLTSRYANISLDFRYVQSYETTVADKTSLLIPVEI